MTLLSRRTVTVVALCLAWPCFAASRPVMTEQLQQDAMSCAGEAVQICPEVMTAADHGVSCMVKTRSGSRGFCDFSTGSLLIGLAARLIRGTASYYAGVSYRSRPSRVSVPVLICEAVAFTLTL